MLQQATVRALLSEHGKQMSFIKNETSKTLQAIVSVATASKTLSALLNFGLKYVLMTSHCIELVSFIAIYRLYTLFISVLKWALMTS